MKSDISSKEPVVQPSKVSRMELVLEELNIESDTRFPALVLHHSHSNRNVFSDKDVGFDSQSTPPVSAIPFGSAVDDALTRDCPDLVVISDHTMLH